MDCGCKPIGNGLVDGCSKPRGFSVGGDGLNRGIFVIDATTNDDDDRGVALKRVVIVTYPGLQALDVVGPYEVFAGANTALRADGRSPGYQLLLCGSPADTNLESSDLQPNFGVESESGLRLAVDPLPAATQPMDTLLIPGGQGVHRARENRALITWIQQAAPNASRIATVCTGTFLAAEAGLLEGRTVTTHWARAKRLADDFPSVNVDAEAIYRRDGNIWSSAGVTAGIDLALALVADDFGTDIAQTVSRWLVMFLHRPGGQSQFAAPVWTTRAQRNGIVVAQQSVESEPALNHTVSAMARRAHMSTRHFSRLFTSEIGESPARFVERVRVQRARDLLETTAEGLETIAADCGFGNAETLRRAFHRQLSVPPDSYRSRFHRTSANALTTSVTHQ